MKFGRHISNTGMRAASMLALLGLLNGCSSVMSQKVSHSGFSTVIPPGWVDYSAGGTDFFEVGRAPHAGRIFFHIEEAPGDSEESITLARDVFVKHSPDRGTEESINSWYQFKGHGVRFRYHYKDGEVREEKVFFFPEGNLSGWYITAYIDRANIAEARRELEGVIQRFKVTGKTKPD